MMYIILKIVIFVLLTVSCMGFFYYLRKKQLVKNTIQEVLNSIDHISKEQARELRRNLLYHEEREEKGFRKWIDKPRKRFVYARMDHLVPGLTIELWMILQMVLAAMIYFVSYALSKHVFISIVIAGIYLGVLYMFESILAVYNYKRVEANLIKFIDLLGNYGVVSGDIIGVLHRISPMFSEPLRGVMEECYFDAQTSGDAPTALYSMAEKIEHPKFKELIRNIESCIRYTSNFQSAVEHSRKVIMDEQKAKREQESMIIEMVISLFFISAGLIFSLYVVGDIVGQSAKDILLNTTLGKCMLAIIFITILAFVIEIIKLER